MVINLLLTLLLLEWIIIYLTNGRTLFSPSIIACSMFILSTVVFIFSKNYFNYEIHLKTVAVITVSLFFIFLGEQFSNGLFRKKEKPMLAENKSAEPIYIAKIWIFAIFMFVLLTGILYFRDVYKYSLTVGNTSGDYLKMAKFVREDGGYQMNTFISQSKVLSECLIYFLIYIFCNNIVIAKVKTWRYLFPILPYLFYILAADDRVGILRVCIVISVIFFIFEKRRTGWRQGNNKKIIITGLTVVVIYIIVFRGLGYRTDTSVRNPLWNNLSQYIASSIVGLDTYLTNGEPDNILFGQTVFKSIYAILRQWGLNIPVIPWFDSFYTYAGGSSNIYTAFKSYIKDFTLLGELCAMFLWGFIINNSINRIKSGKVGFVRACMLGLFFYPVVMISIGDVTPSVLTITTLYMLFYFIVLEWFLFKVKRRT